MANQRLGRAGRAGRVLYYSAVPDTVPMNWRTGRIDPSATANQWFWKEYIDFVLGARRHPRLHTWFGPLTMPAFLAVESDAVSYNWFAGTTAEAQTWQLKAGIRSALDVRTAGLAPKPFNGLPDAMNPAIGLAWLITQDAAGSRPWPTFAAYTNATGLASGGAPTKWCGLSRAGPGYSTPRNPARVHAIAFGELFEPTTPSALKTRGLEFLRNVQIAGGTQPGGVHRPGEQQDHHRHVHRADQQAEAGPGADHAGRRPVAPTRDRLGDELDGLGLPGPREPVPE